MEHSITQAAKMFNRSTETIRTWAREFSEFMSPTATPEKGRTRRFTEGDLKVFALVAQYKSDGLTFDEALVALQNGQRGRIPEPETMLTDSTPQVQITQLQELVVALREDVKKAEIDVAVAQNERDIYKHQLEDLRKEMRELLMEIGRLKALQGEDT